MTNPPIEPEESLVCPSCHAPNEPLAGSCVQCGVPLASSFVLGPIGQIQAEGFALRDATGGAPKPIVLIGIWLLFFPVFIGFAVYLGIEIYSGIEWSFGAALGLTIPVFLLLFSAVLLYQTTANYFRKRGKTDGKTA